jgi:hypothetical protein
MLGQTQSYNFTRLFTRRLTTDEIKQLFTTPIVLLLNPPAGSMLIVESIGTFLDFKTTPYNDAVPPVLLFKQGFETLHSTDILAGTERIYSYSISGTAETLPADGLIVSAETQDPIDGDSDVIVKVFYKIVNCL